jgi:hypothetical protein
VETIGIEGEAKKLALPALSLAWHLKKCSKTCFLEEKTLSVAFTEFCGINIPNQTNFKLPV